MDAIRRPGPPIVVPVVIHEIIQIKAPGSREGALVPEFDLAPRSFYIENRDIGRAMYAPRMSAREAVQRLVFG